MGGFVVGMVRFSLLRLLILPLRQLIFMRILDVCFSYIISRPRYTCYVPSYAYQPIERDWSKAWMKPNWSFWILKCVFLPLPGKNTVKDGWPKVWLPTPRRMYFVGYTQFTSHCVGYTQFTPSNTVSFTGGVYLIPFDLKCSVLTLLLYPFNPNFRSWYKEGTKYIKPSRMHERWQLLVYISSSRRGRRGKGMILSTPINMV